MNMRDRLVASSYLRGHKASEKMVTGEGGMVLTGRADFADVARFRQKPVEEGQLALALVGELRVQAEPRPDARRTASQC